LHSLSNVTENPAAPVLEHAERVLVPTGDALLADNGEFFEKFNRRDFMFDHGLAHHPLFELSSLKELARRIPKYKDFVYWQNGSVAVNDKWGTNTAKRLSLDETIDGIEHNDSLVILKHADQDPVFGPLLQEILQRIWSFTPPAAQADIVLGESLIFLNSPRRKTAYHMDLESNFLLQIAGVKYVRVFDCTDRSITPHLELENHCRGDHNGAVYKPEHEADAHHYHLTAGHGVHFPSIGPHWVQNGDELSISININFDLISIHQRMKHIYRVNRLMRRFGIEPAGPGSSKIRDSVKENISRGITAVQRTLARRDVPMEDLEIESYPAWRPNRQADPARR